MLVFSWEKVSRVTERTAPETSGGKKTKQRKETIGSVEKKGEELLLEKERTLEGKIKTSRQKDKSCHGWEKKGVGEKKKPKHLNSKKTHLKVLFI